MEKLRVRAVTSWGTPCGIAEHTAMLMEGMAGQVEITPDAEGLDPEVIFKSARWAASWDVLWLNYHAALHSRWTGEVIRQFKQEFHCPVVVTYHDTYDGEVSLNSVQAHSVASVADRFIVHEPVADIASAVYMRQGIPHPDRPARSSTPPATARSPTRTSRSSARRLRLPVEEL